MVLNEKIQTILANNGINLTSDEIESYITQTKELIGFSKYEYSLEHDYVPNFVGNVFVTHYYPLNADTVKIKINKQSIIPEYIDEKKGILYLPREYQGVLTCEYQAGIQSDTLEEEITPIILAYIRDKTGHNIASVTEGNVSVTYKTSTSTDNTSLDSLINKFENRYGVLIRMV